jgi:phenylalanyl-tRNA synthetase beta chain
MKVSYNWLREFVEIELDPEALAERLTLSGAEVERVEKITPAFSGVVAARVAAIDPDPKKPGWSWCRVEAGGRELTALCAAPNLSVGLLTAAALPGAVLPGGRVEAKQMGERISEAVLCSEQELGLGDDEGGVIELPPSLAPGQPLEEAPGIVDSVLEIDVTPNRPDLLSIRGVARDIAALTGRPLLSPEEIVLPDGPEIGEEAGVTVEDYSLCPRYCARLIRGVRVGPSPFPIRRRLRLGGIKPVNNVVDATNYLLLELGHPLHAFDHAALKGGEVIVRAAREGESIVTIDGSERVLPAATLVIADREKPVAVAGVMGGLHSEIGEGTANVLLESAVFNPVSIRRTGRALGMSTEASRRFERGADPEIPPFALDRAAALIVELAGGRVARGVIDRKQKDFSPPAVIIRPERAGRLLGYPVSPDLVKTTLSRLGLEHLEGDRDRLRFSIPPWRPDLTREVDLVEELARLTGFDRIPAHLPTAEMISPPDPPERTVPEAVREVLLGLGLDEVITYSFLDPKSLDRLGLEPDNPLRRAGRITNPVNKEQCLLRTTLIPGLLEVLSGNYNRKVMPVNIFEWGAVFGRENSSPPRERTLLSLLISGPAVRPDWRRPEPETDFFTLKGILELLGGRLRLGPLVFSPREDPVFQPGQCARIEADGVLLGVAGKVSARVLEAYSISAPVFLAELEAGPFLAAAGGDLPFLKLDQYPAVRRDMALVVDESLPYRTVGEALERHRPELLEDYELFDLYRGSQVPEGKKSFAFRLNYRSRYDTLCEATVNKVHQEFQDALISELGCSFR